MTIDKIHFKCALITGASSGIGEALSYLLAKKGISLILAGRNQERLSEIAIKTGAQEIIVADLSEPQERQKIIQAIHQKVPDLVINNAGFGTYGDALTIPIAEQLSILEVNGAAPLEITLEAAQTLVKAGKEGVILNVSSVAGEFPCPGMTVYGAAKSFLTHASEGINTEVSSKGVSVLVCCPGMVETDFANRAAKKKIFVKGRQIMTPEFVAKQIWEQVQIKKEKQIINWHYRFSSILATYLLPTSLIKNIIWNQIKKRL